MRRSAKSVVYFRTADYVLSPELDRLVQEKLSTGKYQPEQEVLFLAMHALEERDVVIAGVQDGYQDFEAGRYQILEEIDAQLRAKYQIGKDS